MLKIETEGEGMTLQGETFIVESGGDIEVDKLDLIADTLTVEDSAKITANGKVRFNNYYDIRWDGERKLW